MFSKKFFVVLAVLSLLGIMTYGMIGSGAWFTDGATSNVGSFSSGTLSIDDAKVSTVVLGSVANIAPGYVSNQAEIIIKNNGTIPLAWFGDVQFTGDDTLYQNMYVKYAKVEFLTPSGATWFSDPGFDNVDRFIVDGKGAGHWPITWTGPDALAMFPVFNNNNSMALGTDYEFMGALLPGYSYKITLQFGFWTGAGNLAQGKGPLNIAFHVDATQVDAGALTALFPTGADYLGWMNTQIADQTEN